MLASVSEVLYRFPILIMCPHPVLLTPAQQKQRCSVAMQSVASFLTEQHSLGLEEPRDEIKINSATVRDSNHHPPPPSCWDVMC